MNRSNYERNSPKSSADIRDSLKSLHHIDRQQTPTGPRVQGAVASDQIVIASFYNLISAEQYQRALSAAGVHSSSKKFGRKYCVSVDHEDGDQAWAVFEEHRRKHPDRLPPSLRRDFDGLIFCVTLGASAVGVVLFSAWDFFARHPHSIVLAFSFLTLCAITGLFFDRVRAIQRVYGRFRMSTFDYLLAVCAIAAVLSFFVFDL